MKYIFFAFIALTFSLGFNSCQKYYDPTPANPDDTTTNVFKGSFTCTIDGNSFTAETKNATVTDNNGVKTLVITGIKYALTRDPNVYEQVTLTITNYTDNKRYVCNSDAVITYTNHDGYGTSYTFTSLSNVNYYVELTGTYVGVFNAVMADVNNNSNRFILENGEFDL